ncbi:hypothetical protein C943_01750 [Mariniradius saccharolyticus AK6]|uniref:Uncharacterized protein n=1 Tax=Mariniradius saccharolyticus AK6 TaxID=1239962 RepID=M7X3F7_9BACT|nr:hypothetical protein C943_01750 [Mariniradius saccharolyticus AK6]
MWKSENDLRKMYVKICWAVQIKKNRSRILTEEYSAVVGFDKLIE